MKKQILTIFILTLLIVKSFAECTTSNISVWPKNGEICLNSMFIIEGYGTSQDVIRKLNNKYKIYLKADNSIISLQVIKVYEGKYQLTQAILKPTTNLIEGKTYMLQIDSLDHYEKEDFNRNSFKWKVNNINDNGIPSWKQKPKYLSKEKIHFGCGPSLFVNFCVYIKDNSPIVVFTKLTELKTSKVTEYFVSPDSTLLRIGHGMCSGEFDFQDGEDYEISFSLMDASGNINDTLTSAIKFISPTDNDGESSEDKKNCNCDYDDDTEVYSIKNIVLLSLAIFSLVGIALYFRRKVDRR